MNSHADVSLPMAMNERGHHYDPIYKDAVDPRNVGINTIYDSPGLILISVSWSWAVALKLARFQKNDPHDIAQILSLGYRQTRVVWTARILEEWIRSNCWAMGYDGYNPVLMENIRNRIQSSIDMTRLLNPAMALQPGPASQMPSAYMMVWIPCYFAEIRM
ncbi:hypothetical protein QCA50_004182 [Cerrena zonata]|uniref:Uncharacterized protein n=1 Tax=Cerrena zonata TaxID=2478898 RepID=A0AAW0GKS8_9APHY